MNAASNRTASPRRADTHVAWLLGVSLALFGTAFGCLVPAVVVAVEARNVRQLWTCGMHPQVIRDEPGNCPICGMVLTPLRSDTTESPQLLRIDPVVVQNMGIRVAPVVLAPLRHSVRAVAYLAEPSDAQLDITLRVSGWIDRLYANVDGMHLARGDRLFDLYSPELLAAIEEWIAVQRGGSDAATLGRMASSVRRKLELLGLSRDQIDAFGALDRAPTTVTFYSPSSGHVTEKLVNTGSAVRAGELVLRLSDRSKMWLDLQLYEQDLPLVRIGDRVTATVGSLPGLRLEGEISFLHPHVDPQTRTAVARVILDNRDGRLRQGMYASVEVHAQVGELALQVPREAVIDSGLRQVAFVALGDGRFEPRVVRTGVAGEDGQVQIVSGLAEGESIVRSGQFLLDTESRLREAIRKHLDENRGSSTAGEDVEHDPRDH